MEYQLTIDKLLLQTLQRRSANQIVHGGVRRAWPEEYERIRRLASALEGIGVARGSKVAVLDYDTDRYLEAYYAVPMMGAILHTVNIRLPVQQVIYTAAHAGDEVLLVREDLVPLASKIIEYGAPVKKVVVMGGGGGRELDYEELLAAGSPSYTFPAVGENEPATLFYTSGTTGNPKGVSFSHRQIVLHTLSSTLAFATSIDPLRLRFDDVLMPLVPFFHVHAWGIPYVAGLFGAKIVLAGKYEPARILDLIEREAVTFSNMVPTVLDSIISHPSATEHRDSLARWKVVIGGAALSRELMTRARRLGIGVVCGYGLSETAPVLTHSSPVGDLVGLPEDQLLERALLKTGLPIPLVEMRVVDDGMREMKHDGRSSGEIVVRSPWLAKEYLGDPDGTDSLWQGGWLHTGDIAVMDENGYVKVVDRKKDAVKSGGEWISTIQLEDLLLRHPAVGEAVVIGVKHDRWGERPVAVVSLAAGARADEGELRDHLREFVARGQITDFWVPDRIIISDGPLPKTSTGKLDKKPLREKYSLLLSADQGRAPA